MSNVKIRVNLTQLKWFETPVNLYRLAKREGRSYGNVHTIKSNLERMGLVHMVYTQPSKKNQSIKALFFQVTKKGQEFLAMFED